MSRHRIVVIGAAGEMASLGIERLGAHGPDCMFELYDLDIDQLQELAAKLPPGRASVGRLDLFDDEALRRVVEGASLVVLGAGPYMRTGPPVMRACIASGVDYLDFDDDIESTEDALRLDQAARDAGIACLVGCGASPGMSNIIAVDAASQLDEVESLDVCFVSGDEGARPYGAAVIEHILHISAGECVAWRDGYRTVVEAAAESEVFPMGGVIGDYRLYEVAHPETVTLPRRFPNARSIRVMGGAYPQPVNGLIQGLARAVEAEKMSVPEAVEWFQAVMRDENGSLKGWRYALSGMLAQIRNRESSVSALSRFLWRGLRKQHEPYCGCLLARAVGVRDGKPAKTMVKTPTGGPGTYLGSSLRAITGTCLAAFVALALDRLGEHRGVLAPEDWVVPPQFYAALQQMGAPREEIIETHPKISSTKCTAEAPSTM